MKLRSLLPALLALAVVWTLISQASPGADSFRAAAVKIDITPDRPQQLLGYGARVSEGIHTPIHHRILALDDGRRKMVIVSTEVCLVSPSEYDRVAALVQEAHGIAPIDFLWTVTHTHSAPELGPPGMGAVYMPQRYTHEYDRAYADEVTEKLLDGIGQALASLQPARLGVGFGTAEANINRRERTPDGKIRLGRNPQGPVDRKIGVLKFVKRDSDELIASVANYAIHGTVLGGKNLLISGDAPGVVSAHVEGKTGAPLLFINGAAGNVAPIYSVFPTPKEGRIDEFETRLGDPVLDAIDAIANYRDSPTLHPEEIRFETPRKEGLGWAPDMDSYAGTDAAGAPLVRMPCRSLRIDDDILIWTAPVELFCEMSNTVRDASPFPFTFYFGYTNGWFGYLTTAVAFDEGGYESTVVTPFTPAAERSFTDLIADHVKGRSGER